MQILKRLSSLRWDLGLQILILYTLVLVSVLISGFFFGQYSLDQLRKNAMAADISLARAIAQETDTILANAMRAVEELSTYDEVRTSDIVKMDVLFAQVNSVRSDTNLIYRLDADGFMVYHYPTGPRSTLGQDFSFREYFKLAQTTREPLMSTGRISPTTQMPVSTAVMPIWEEDQFLGVVATNIVLQSFSQTLASIAAEFPADEGFEVMILDSAGSVIAHPQSEALLLGIDEVAPNLAKMVSTRTDGNLVAPDNSGDENLYSIVHVPSVKWSVVVSRPTSVAFAAPNIIQRSIVVVLIGFIVVGLIFWYVLFTRILRPLEWLTEYSHTIGRNVPANLNLQEKLNSVGSRNDPLGYLTSTFNQMEAAIQDRFEELATLLETSAAVVSTLNPQEVLERILEQVERLMGTAMCAVVALDESRGVFHTVASRGLSKRYAEQMVISPDEQNSATLRALRTGEPVQIEDTEIDPSFSPFRPRARAEGYRSFAAIPLNTTHSPPAALVLYSPTPQKFSSREIDLLINFSNHAAMAIENAELYARSDARLQEQTRRLEALIQSLESGLLLEDLEGRIIYANRQACSWIGEELGSVIGNLYDSYYHKLLKFADDPAETFLDVKRYLSLDKPKKDFVLDLNLPEGLRHLRVQGFVVTNSVGTPIGRGQILRDVTRRYELDRLKSSLISTASHELRTPLASIKGYATTLLADDVDWDEEAQREFLQIISNEADRLSDLVNNLLDMSRIEAGNVDLVRFSTSAELLVQQAVDRSFPDMNGEMDIQIDPDLPLLYVDQPRIELVLRNLIENAVKYGGKEKTVRISAIRKDQNVIFTVRDEGPGIPPAEKENVFASFYRSEKHRYGSTAGVGLGLAICQGFVKAHNGDIWIDDVETGASISFSLPILREEEIETDQNTRAKRS